MFAAAALLLPGEGMGALPCRARFPLLPCPPPTLCRSTSVWLLSLEARLSKQSPSAGSLKSRPYVWAPCIYGVKIRICQIEKGRISYNNFFRAQATQIYFYHHIWDCFEEDGISFSPKLLMWISLSHELLFISTFNNRRTYTVRNGKNWRVWFGFFLMLINEFAVISDVLGLAPVIKQGKVTKCIFWFHQGDSEVDFHCSCLHKCPQVLNPIRSKTRTTRHDWSGKGVFAVSL